MSASEKFCLRWNDFESNISVAFRELREEKDFFDVTLSVGPGHQHIQAHKLILSACSPFFRGVLRQNPHAHPLLYLKGVGFSELQAVLNFMYHGEVNVAQEELNSFLAVAEELQVKGLTQGGGGASSQSAPSKPRPQQSDPAPRPRPTEPPRHTAPPAPQARPKPPAPFTAMVQDDDIQEVMPIKSEPAPYAPQPPPPAASHQQGGVVAQMEEEQYGEEGYEDYGGYEGGEGYDQGLMEGDQNKDLVRMYAVKTGEGKLSCNLCGHVTHKTYNMRSHLEGKHQLGGYQCDICFEAVHSTKQALYKHKLLCQPKPVNPLA